MKKATSLITVVIVFLTLTAKAQETVWFDANWKVTTENQAKYYRPAPQKRNNGFWIIDYYKNGSKQMEGFSSVTTTDKELYDGLIMYYHENGKPFHKANYKDGKLQGKRDVYYKTGELKQSGTYTQGKRDGVWKTFYKNGKIESKGKYRNGEKVGVWKTFYKNVY